jgi:hypothetical protein
MSLMQYSYKHDLKLSEMKAKIILRSPSATLVADGLVAGSKMPKIGYGVPIGLLDL